jgi:hypothetical protein
MFLLGPAVDSFQLEVDGATEKYLEEKINKKINWEKKDNKYK